MGIGPAGPPRAGDCRHFPRALRHDGAVPLDDHDLQTESFSNAKGWSAVRVTHVPSATVAERHRSEALRSAVQAQRECIDELEMRLSGKGEAPPAPEPEGPGEGGGPATAAPVVSRAEFAALEERIARLERRLLEADPDRPA